MIHKYLRLTFMWSYVTIINTAFLFTKYFRPHLTCLSYFKCIKSELHDSIFKGLMANKRKIQTQSSADKITTHSAVPIRGEKKKSKTTQHKSHIIGSLYKLLNQH